MKNLFKIINVFKYNFNDMKLGIGDWAQSPIPNPHNINKIILNKNILNKKYY